MADADPRPPRPAAGAPSRKLEHALTAGTWVLTAVHVVWFYFYLQAMDEPGSLFSLGDWWGFCKTVPGAVTMVAALACSIAQAVVMFRTSAASLDDSKILRRPDKPKSE